MTPSPHVRTRIAFALAAVFATSAAFAQDAGPRPDPAAPAAAPAQAPVKKTWADLDVDHNGSLDKQEAAALPALANVFDKADANGDGQLTGDEYKAYLDANAAGQSQNHQSQ